MAWADWWPFAKRQTVNTTHPRDPVIAAWFGGDSTTVNSREALGIPAVYACVNVLAETIGALPLSVWERTPDGGRQEATGHPLYELFHGRPTSHMTAVEWIEWCVSSSALRGDAPNEIVMDRAGQVREVRPIPYDAVKVDRDERGLFYDITEENRVKRRLRDDALLRLPWKMQPDGKALSPLALQRESFAISVSARRYQSRLLDNNAAPKGGIRVPTSIGDEAAEALIESWNRRHKGPENAGKMAIFDGGLEWVSIGMSNDDAQFAELMQMSVRDVARVFRVQPHKIGDLENATFSNIEHQSIEFLTDTILPWVRRLEARFDGWLLSAPDRQAGISTEFNLRGLLRGDAAARAQLYQTLFYAGAISPNEIRRFEGMDPIDGGDRYYVQGASVPVDLIGQVVAGDTPGANTNDES